MTATAPHPIGPDAERDAGPALTRWEVLAERLQAVADPTRLRLLAALHAMPHQQGCVSELTAATGLAQPSVSRHLQILHRAALLHRSKHGSRTYYQLSVPALHDIADDLTTPTSLCTPGTPPPPPRALPSTSPTQRTAKYRC